MSHFAPSRNKDVESISSSDESSGEAFFAALLDRYQHTIYRICIGRLGRLYGEDVAQEVFVAAWEQLSSLSRQYSDVDSTGLRNWLMAVAGNKCKQVFRNTSRRQALAEEFLWDIQTNLYGDSMTWTPFAEESGLDEQRAQQLLAGLRKLRQDDQLIIKMRYLQAQTTADIAELFGVSEAALRKRLQRAIKHLQTLIHRQANG